MASYTKFICNRIWTDYLEQDCGESKQKFLYIPEPHNDFIFSILGEELGFIGCIAVLILFAIFIWRGVLIAMRAPDLFGSLVAIGITALVAIQVIINVAVVTSSMPATGMPLPFFSYRRNSVVYFTLRNGNFTEYIKSKCKIIVFLPILQSHETFYKL